MHVVVFPGWYPSKIDKLSGDFIQRHLRAISKQCKVSVIIPIKDNSIQKAHSVKNRDGNLTELYSYYPSVSSIKWIDNFFSFIRYNYHCLIYVKSIQKEEKVNLAHIYVLQKNHFTGVLLQWLFKIPYVVSEQSTLYVDGGYEKMNLLKKQMWKYAFKKATSYHGVSRFLVSNISNKLGLTQDGVIIPNVIDADLFYYNHELVNCQTTFVHVSNMVYQKNVEGMLLAFAEAKKQVPYFALNLVGPVPSNIPALVAELDLTKEVVIYGEKNYVDVAHIMQQSDVFVFFTRFETFGCVVIEANACGLPVIISDLEVTRELVTNNFNGVFVESENVKDLVEKIVDVMQNPQKFDPLAISMQTRSKYNYQLVGRTFMDWYASINKENGKIKKLN